MLYKDMFNLCSKIRTKHINILRERNLEIVYVRLDGT
jgi:hypothetical protein